MASRRLILVGGFLGAGKTTLLAQAEQRLARRGLRVGIITNDQGNTLVDTAVLDDGGRAVREVGGGCFCCRFGCLLSASDLLVDDFDSDVLLAEPVGSCTDISATVLQPLKQYYSRKFTVGPFSVLVDPARLREALGANGDSLLPTSISYIFLKQLEEADLIVLNKVDLLSQRDIAELKDLLAAKFPGRDVLEMSASRARGIDAWLETVMGDGQAGSRIAKVDYDTYAEGEAALGWLNASVELRLRAAPDWEQFCIDLLARLQEKFRAGPAEIAHVKLLLAGGAGGRITGSLTSSRGAPVVSGSVPGSAREALLTINARVHVSPDELQSVVAECLRASAGEKIEAEFVELESFSPSRPQPEHRFDAIVHADAHPAPSGRKKV